jgi:hypothetical protein
MAEDNSKPSATEEVPAVKVKIPLPIKRRGKAAKKAKAKRAGGGRRGAAGRAAYPKDSLAKCLRIPQAILEQNAGQACTDREAAAFAKVGWTGDIGVEISSRNQIWPVRTPVTWQS